MFEQIIEYIKIYFVCQSPTRATATKLYVYTWTLLSSEYDGLFGPVD